MLVRMPRARVSVREGGHRDLRAQPSLDLRGAGKPGDTRLRVRRARRLHPIDELSQLSGALEVAQEGVVLVCALGRVAPQRQEIQDAGVQELSDEGRRGGIGVADAGDVCQRLDGGLVSDEAQHVEGAAAGRAAGTIGDRDELGSCGGEVSDRLVKGALASRGPRRVHLERERHAAGRAGVEPGGRGTRVGAHDGLFRVEDGGRAAADWRTGRNVFAGGCRARLSLLPGLLQATWVEVSGIAAGLPCVLRTVSRSIRADAYARSECQGPASGPHDPRVRNTVDP